jgi:AAA15 family ATPase/GTPase
LAPLRSLKIVGYRGIEKFKLEPKKINVFVGRNNTGKSSVLEAATLLATSSTGYLDALGKDILNRFAARKNWNLKYFIKIGHKGCKIEGTIPTRPRRIAISMKYATKGIPTGFIEKSTPLLDRYAITTSAKFYRRRIVAPRTREIEERRKLAETEMAEREMAYENAFRNIMNQPKLFILNSVRNNVDIALPSDEEVLRSSPEIRSNTIFIGTDYEVGLKDLHDNLLPTSDFSPTMESVRKDLPYLADIRSLGEEIFVYKRKAGEPIPIPLMGEGFIEVLRIVFISALARGGTVVLEEPENHLHPGFMNLTAKYLVDAVQKNKIQLFISTHSTEFLKYLLEKAKEDICVIRMHGAGSPEDYEVLSGREAVEESEKMGLDLRGV